MAVLTGSYFNNHTAVAEEIKTTALKITELRFTVHTNTETSENERPWQPDRSTSKRNIQ